MSDTPPWLTQLAPGAEFDRIRELVARMGGGASGLGDDCALLPDAPGTLVVSTDAAVESIHFQTAWLPLADIGWRASAAAISDLAAMGAQPTAQLVALVVPRMAGDEDPTEMMDGVGELARKVGCPVVGGDLTRGGTWTITVTVLGRAVRPVLRQGASVGDGLWVTGALGGARAALEAWRGGREPSPEVRARFARPVPRIPAGIWLSKAGATAMIDLSDGLAGDIRHLAAASDVGIEVDLNALPLDVGVEEAARGEGTSAARFAAIGGEDYELLATLPADFSLADAGRFQEEVGLPLTRIGTVTAGEVQLFDEGSPISLDGWDHFR